MNLGNLNYFLGIEVFRSKKIILLNQRKNALELITNTGLSGAKPVYAPLEKNIKLTTIDYDEFSVKSNNPLL